MELRPSWSNFPKFNDGAGVELVVPSMDFAVSKGGLLRLPRFIRLVIHEIRQQQVHRASTGDLNLVISSVRLPDIVYCLIIAVVFLGFRLSLQRVILPRIFRNRTKQLITKLTEDLFYTVYYVLSFCYFALVVLRFSDWGSNLLSNRTKVVRDLLHPFPPPMNTYDRWYYVQAGGFYLSASVFLLAFDSRRSDFGQLVIHHIVSLCMIAMSYLYGYFRVGIIVLALHDVGDILLYSSKFFHRLGVRGVDIFLFTCFAITFYITRLVAYARIVHTISIETLQTLVQEPTFNRWALFYDTYLPHYVLFVFSLCTLLVLHCYWFTLILRLIADELFFGKKIVDQGDIRSDDEDENEELVCHEDDESQKSKEI